MMHIEIPTKLLPTKYRGISLAIFWRKL